MRPRALALVPALLLQAACAATVRGGGGVRTLGEQAVLEGQGTAGAGLGTAGDALQLVVPVAVAAGKSPDGDASFVAFESGVEYAGVPEGDWGFRIGPRLGAGLSGFTGAFVALRGGPSLTLAPIEPDGWIPTASLEALAGVGLGAELGGKGLFGASLCFGWDRYGSFGVPSHRSLRDRRGGP